MIREFPAFVLGRLGPLLARVFRPDLQAETWGVIEQHADLFDHTRRERSSAGILDRDRAFPGDQQRALRHSLDGVTSRRLRVGAKKLAGKSDRVGLRANPRHPQSQTAIAERLAAVGLEVVGSPTEDAAGDLAAIVASVVDVIAGEQ